MRSISRWWLRHSTPTRSPACTPSPAAHRPGQPLGPVEQFAVGEFVAVLVDDGDPAGVAGGGLPQFAGQPPAPPAQRAELCGDPDRAAGGEQPALVSVAR